MKSEQITNWNTADKNGNINVPDYLDPAINKVGTQLRFHTISGKNEIQTICDIVKQMEGFFKDHYSSKNELIIPDVSVSYLVDYFDDNFITHHIVIVAKDEEECKVKFKKELPNRDWALIKPIRYSR